MCNSDHSEILAYNLDGKLLKTVSIPSNVYFIEFTLLPNGGFALLNNYEDRVYFIDSTGTLRSTANIIDSPDNHHMQNLSGIVVNNHLILSEDGQMHFLAFDLDTFERSIFKDFNGLAHLWLGSRHRQGLGPEDEAPAGS